MEYFIFIIKTAISDFIHDKTRTFLTSLGILIGVASVVLLLALGSGLKEYISQQFESLGTNLVMVLPGKMFSGGKNFSQSSMAGISGGIKFDEKDIRRLKRIKEAVYVVPAFIKSISASALGNTELADLYATTEDLFALRNLEVYNGRVFNKADVNKKAKIVVIGPTIAEKLFGNKDLALGKTIRIDNSGYKVIGVLEPKGGGGFGGPDFDSFIYMPYKTAYVFNPNKTFFAVYLKATDKNVVDTVKAQAQTILLKRYKEDDFSVAEQTEILNTVTSIFEVINMILVGIGTISLIVGGVGIMNIMYVSVIERTREVGIRRAVGATQSDILFQFLTESVFLSLFGGMMGVVLSYLVVFLIQSAFPAYISLSSLVVAVVVSSLVGIIFGVFPAQKAARLSPIEAIRYE